MARRLRSEEVLAAQNAGQAVKSGQIIMIYEDPITRQRSEGKAQIIRYLETIEAGIDRYLVHFVGDPCGQNVERIVVNSA